MKILHQLLPLSLGLLYGAVGLGVLWRIFRTAGQLQTASDWFFAAFFFVAALCSLAGGVYYLRQARRS